MIRMSQQSSGSIHQEIGRLFAPGSPGTTLGLGEAGLLARFVDHRDEAAFETLVSRFGPMVLGVCRRKLRDPRDVEDAFQATFLILARRARSIRDRDLLGNWLFGVAHRVSSRARANAAKRLAREGGPPDSPPLASSFSGYSPERAELSRVLDEEISRLPDPLRRAVLLCYFDGLTHDEASRRLGWPVGTVRSRLARARRTLRVRLTRLGLAPTSTSSALSALLCPPSLYRLSLPTQLLGSTVRLALGTSSVGASSLVGALVPAVGVASPAALASGYMKSLLFGRLLAGLAACLAAGGLVAGGAVARSAARGEQEGKEHGGTVARSDEGEGEAIAADQEGGQGLGDEAFGTVVHLHRIDATVRHHYVGIKLWRELSSDELKRGEAFLIRPSPDGPLPFTQLAALKLPDTTATMPERDVVLVEVVGAKNPARAGDLVVTRMDGALVLPLPGHPNHSQDVAQPTSEPPSGDSLAPAIAAYESSQSELARALARWEWSREMFARTYISQHQNNIDRQRAIEAIDTATSALDKLGDQLLKDAPSKRPPTPPAESGNLPGDAPSPTQPDPRASAAAAKPEIEPHTEPEPGELVVQAEPPPPRKYRDIVFGKITKTDPDGVAVELSIGGEAGVVVGQKFWVVRGNPTGWMPRDRYGDIVISWVGPGRSIGVLIPEREGDHAAVGDTAEASVVEPGEVDSATQPPTIHLKTRRFAVPFQSSPLAARDGIDSLLLYASLDKGVMWDFVGEIDPKKRWAFTHSVHKDGEYLFAIRGRTSEGVMTRPADQPFVPVLRVVVDTTPPAIEVASVERIGGQVKLRWRIDEKLLDPGSPELTHVIDDKMKWNAPIETTPGNDGEAVWKVAYNAPLTIRLRAADLAGNESTITHIIPPSGSFGLNPLPEPEQPQKASDGVPGPVGLERVVRGEITKNDIVGGFVELSIGSDDGIVSGQSLRALRAASSESEWLEYGSIVVIRAEAGRSIGWLVGARDGEKGAVGDRVAGVAGGTADKSTVQYTRHKEFRFPFQTDPDMITALHGIELYVLHEGKRSWEWVATAPPKERLWFTFIAPHDGNYLFAVRNKYRPGAFPATAEHLPEPVAWFLVDSVPPTIRVVSQDRIGNQIRLRWEIDDPALDPRSPGLSFTRLFGPGTNANHLEAPSGPDGEMTWTVDTDEPIVATLKARDLAGNEQSLSRVIAGKDGKTSGQVSDPQLELDPLPSP